MPTRTRRPAAAKTRAQDVKKAQAEFEKKLEFSNWDELVAEAHIDVEPYVLPGVPVFDEDGKTTDERVDLTIPCPSGTGFTALRGGLERGDLSGVIVSLGADDDELTDHLWKLCGKADFPVVDLLATKVLRHYFKQNGSPLDNGLDSGE
jgi:hypothetical protein